MDECANNNDTVFVILVTKLKWPVLFTKQKHQQDILQAFGLKIQFLLITFFIFVSM